MTSAPLDEIDHIACTVANIESSVRWYQTSFSCEVLYQDAQSAVLSFANIKLALTLPSKEPAHLGFVRKDAETLGDLRKKTDGTLSTFVADPSGNPIEIIAPNEGAIK